MNLSIKNFLDVVVQRLRERAPRRHRSLQCELPAIIEEVVRSEQELGLTELRAEVRRLGVHTSADAADIIRADRDQTLGYGDFVEQLDRITQNPEVMGGKACVRGMRVTVDMIVGQIGARRSIDDVLADFPYLEREDILQALRYAA